MPLDTSTSDRSYALRLGVNKYDRIKCISMHTTNRARALVMRDLNSSISCAIPGPFLMLDHRPSFCGAVLRHARIWLDQFQLTNLAVAHLHISSMSALRCSKVKHRY